MNKISRYIVSIATQGAVGFGPAPGTMATIMMMPLAYFLGVSSFSFCVHISILSLLFGGGFYVVYRALPIFNYTDAPQIVIDEMVSFLWVFVGVPMTWVTLLLGFILFRLLDIYKPFGIAFFEHIPGAVGILADDLAAAVISNFILIVFVRYMSIVV